MSAVTVYVHVGPREPVRLSGSTVATLLTDDVDGIVRRRLGALGELRREELVDDTAEGVLLNELGRRTVALLAGELA